MIAVTRMVIELRPANDAITKLINPSADKPTHAPLHKRAARLALRSYRYVVNAPLMVTTTTSNIERIIEL